jgi:uncharacterized cupin superfamily protein
MKEADQQTGRQFTPTRGWGNLAKGIPMNDLLNSGQLAASMLLGQAGEPAPKTVVPVGPIVQPMPARGPILGWFQREDRPVMNRIQGWFRRDQMETVPQGKILQPKVIKQTDAPPIAPPPTINDFPRKLPNSSGQAPKKADTIAKDTPKEVQQTSLQQPAAATKVKSPILAQLANKMGRDEKFEWVTGQLEIENGNYVIYYATPETIDKYNGRIVLSPQKADMSQFRKGDLVSVRGELIQRSSANGMIPVYRITHASLIERPKAL